jgi:hypothetical protein
LVRHGFACGLEFGLPVVLGFDLVFLRRFLSLLLPAGSRESELILVQTDLCPAFVIRARSPHVSLFAGLEAWGLGGPSRIAVPTANGIAVVARESDRRPLDGFTLQHLAYLEEFSEVLDGNVGYEVPFPRDVFDEAFPLQLLDGFPNRRRADIEFLGKNPLTDGFPRLHNLGNDPLLEDVVDEQLLALRLCHRIST